MMQFIPGRCPECDALAGGMLEEVQGVASLMPDDGAGSYSYEGETAIDWNSQVPVKTPDGRVMLVCSEDPCHTWYAEKGGE
jgi:hypothetical protein